MNIDKAKLIDGWMDETELECLARIAEKCILIFEVGSYKGRSTRALADNTEGTVIAIDPYRGEYYYPDGTVMRNIGESYYNQFNKNLADHILNRKVIHRRMPFLSFHTEHKADFIFLDGDHRYQIVKAEILHARKMLTRRAILAGHDYAHKDWPGVKEAVDEMLGPVQTVNSIWIKEF